MTEYRHIPGVTSPGYVQQPDGSYVRAYVNVEGSPSPKQHIVYKGAPRCPWDGSAMPYTMFNAQRSSFSGPEPGYLFECEICGWEDEIS